MGRCFKPWDTTSLSQEVTELKDTFPGGDTHCTTCSLHLGCRSPWQSSCMPGSPRSLPLRSILSKCLLAISAVVRSPQTELETRHLFSLGQKEEKSLVISFGVAL